MKKMKKLLSVVLAMVLVLSCFSVTGYAAKASYQSVDNIEALDGYSPYGQVTRVDTETRMSILFDTLDVLLAGLNINMGQVIDLLGITITIDLTSVDRLCYSFDSFKSSMNGAMWTIAAGIVNLGVLEELNFDNWQSGMSRDGTAQLTILYELLEALETNRNAVGSVLSNGIELGLVSSFISGLDLSGINKIVTDLPALIKGLIFGLFERWDDTASEITMLGTNATGNGKVEETLNWFVKNLFTNDMSITTVKANSSGATTSKHSLPGESADARVRYIQNGTVLTSESYATQKYVDAQAKLGNTVAVGSYYISSVYYLVEEEINGEKTGDYVWAQVAINEKGEVETDDDGAIVYTGQNLKYYELNTPLLPSLKADITAGKVTIDLNSDSAASLLYKFIPYVFGDLVPTVANGSLKKILGAWFGATYNYVGEVGDDAVNALPDSSNAFFTEAQGNYVWEWSNYAVINGNHYYRFEDQIYAADLSNTNGYFDIINWDYEITADFLNEYIPGADGNTATAHGYTTIFQHLNKFLIKLANEVLAADVLTKVTLTDGDNSKLVNNIKSVAQTIISTEPASIFGSNYADGYYSLIMDSDNDTVLVGIACMIIDLLMPQMSFPSAESVKANGVTVGAPLAAVLRELATQLLPNHNYDALIYSDYNTKTFLSGKDNSYWLDVLLTIGADIGVYYLKNLADMGEDTEEWAGMTAAGWADSKTYVASDLNEINGVKPWEAKIDYIIDWALDKDILWAWKMENMVDTSSFTVDMKTVQDPWVKLDTIFKGFVNFPGVLNVADKTDSNMTDLEYALREKFILSLVNLEWTNIVGGASATGLINIPTTSLLRQADVLTQLITVVRKLLNNIFTEVMWENAQLFPDATFVGVDEIFNQTNIKDLAVNLLDNLKDAMDAGLFDTVLPIVGFFLGWKFNPQDMADPVITLENNNGWAYINGMSTTLKFRNASSGMLEKHRASSAVNGTFSAVEDKPYNIIVSGIVINMVNDDGTVSDVTGALSTTTTFPQTVAPGATLPITYTYTDTGTYVLQFVVTYSYTGKDGAALGGEHTMVMYAYKSESVGDDTIWGMYDTSDADKDYASIANYQRNVFTEDIYTTITEYTQTISYKAATFQIGNKTKNFSTITSDVAPQGQAATYFAHITDRAEAGWGEKLVKDDITSVSGKLFKAKSGVTKDEEFPLGLYDMGRIAVKYGSDSKVWDPDFYFYDDYDVNNTYNDHINRNILPTDVDTSDSNAVAAYNAYIKAFKQIIIDATQPKMIATYVDNTTAFEGHIETLETAWKALQPYLESAGASSSDAEADSLVKILSDALAVAEPGGETPEINFQDYYLYEYFNYQDYRTAVRNRIAQYNKPVAPTGTLWTMDGYGITDNAWDENGDTYAELTNKVYGSASGKRLLGLQAATWEPTQEDMDAYNAAVEAFVEPAYTEMSNLDVAARLVYYKQFLIPKTTNKQFLQKEVDYVTYWVNQGKFTAENYSEQTWTAAVEAYNNAVDVLNKADALQSEVFTAKWELMKAVKNLIEKDKSVLDNKDTYLADLQAAADKADDIFDNPDNYTVKAGIAAAAGFDGTDEEYAYAELIKARGYKYTNQFGDEVVLFDNCAIEYLSWDRENTTSNLKRVNASTEALNTAIANFEAVVSDVTFIGKENNGTTGQVVTTSPEDAEKATGYVYGIKVGQDAKLFFTTNDTGSIDITPSAAGATNGTGAVVVVKDKNDNVVGEYTLIVFGDVDGNGQINTADKGTVDQYVGGTSSKLGGAYELAADLDANGAINTADKGTMDQCVGGTASKISQSVGLPA